MPEVLHNLLHDFSFQQVVLAFIGVVVTIFFGIFSFQRARKELRYEILCDEPLFKMRNGYENQRITVYFDEKRVDNVKVLVVKLINCGNIAIRKEDYDKDISICMGENAKILDTGILEEYPLGITGNDLINNTDNDKSNIIKLNKILLNKGDYFSIKIIGSDCDHEIKIDGHIADGKITKIKKFEKKLLKLLIEKISKGPVFFRSFYWNNYFFINL